jgi:hypothetical protein
VKNEREKDSLDLTTVKRARMLLLHILWGMFSLLLQTVTIGSHNLLKTRPSSMLMLL